MRPARAGRIVVFPERNSGQLRTTVLIARYVHLACKRMPPVLGIIMQNVALTAPSVGSASFPTPQAGSRIGCALFPWPEAAVLAGRVASDRLVLLAQAVLLVGVASLTGFRVRSGIPGMIGIVADAVAFGVALGITDSWLSLRLRDPETAQRALFLPMVPIDFISSAFAPIDRLAGWLRPLARANPVTGGSRRGPHARRRAARSPTRRSTSQRGSSSSQSCPVC